MTEQVKAVVLDWAGTAVDCGSRAPVSVVIKAFAAFDVEVSEAEARVPMGLPKRDHIQALGRLPEVAARWVARHGAPMSDEDVDQIYERFRPLNTATVAEFAAPIRGVLDTVAELRLAGIKIGSTTGYPREVMDVLVPAATDLGYRPDVVVCPDDVPVGRPSPLMLWQALVRLGIWPAAAAVKVDDTAPGIAEGRSAGAWTVGVSLSGNAVGLSEAALDALAPDRVAELRAGASAVLKDAGADYVIDGVAELMPVIAEINRRLAAGERPCGGSPLNPT